MAQSSKHQFFLWHVAMCCLPLLFLYLSLFGTATVLGWLTGGPFLLIVGGVLIGLIFILSRRRRDDPANEERGS